MNNKTRQISELRICDLFKSIPKELTELFSGLEYPWEIIPHIREYILRDEVINGLTELYPGVYVGENVRISPTAELCAPAVICDGAEIRSGAYIRGCVYVGRGAVIGNSTEVKNSIILDGACLPHYNYVGDSVIGQGAHMGAGAIASNLKADKTSVTVHADKDYPTALRKLGVILGDGAEIGCGCVLNPGTVIGCGAVVYPLTSVRGTVPEYSILKSPTELVEKKGYTR